MDTPLEIARQEWFDKHQEECVSCKYYRKGKRVVWCENPLSENEGMDVNDITECDDWREAPW